MAAEIVSVLLLVACAPPPARSARPPSFPLSVAYQPRGFREAQVMEYPAEKEVLEDLRVLYRDGFRGLVTYGAAGVLGRIPELARRLGFDAMIVMGMWDPNSEEEWKNAVQQAKFVDGYCLGNEGLALRYLAKDLESKMAQLRKDTGKPVTTSEPLARYIEGPDNLFLIRTSDWLFPIAHPAFTFRRGGPDTVQWVVVRHDFLATQSRKKIILKEAGFPTAGADWTSEADQLEFFRTLSRSAIPYFHFEAFDQPGKKERGVDPKIEHYWGLYTAAGEPKRAMKWLTASTGANH